MEIAVDEAVLWMTEVFFEASVMTVVGVAAVEESDLCVENDDVLFTASVDDSVRFPFFVVSVLGVVSVVVTLVVVEEAVVVVLGWNNLYSTVVVVDGVELMVVSVTASDVSSSDSIKLSSTTDVSFALITSVSLSSSVITVSVTNSVTVSFDADSVELSGASVTTMPSGWKTPNNFSKNSPTPGVAKQTGANTSSIRRNP